MDQLAHALVGKEITAYTLADNGDSITFTIKDAPPVTLNTWGDCCSETWIESIDAPEALLGVVTAVENIDMPDLGPVSTAKHTGVHIVAYYGLRITTNKGRCVIDYRNDSNGYYGGSLKLQP